MDSTEIQRMYLTSVFPTTRDVPNLRSTCTRVCQQRFSVVMVARTESRADLMYRGISPHDGRKKYGRRKIAAGRKNERPRPKERITRRRPFRRARISSRALDLITKVMRCSTTTLKGIKSYRSTPPLVSPLWKRRRD